MQISPTSALLPSATPQRAVARGFMDAVDAVFDLSQRPAGVLADLAQFTPEDRASFLRVTADLLKQGIVGQETLRVNGRPHKVDAHTRLGDEQLRRAPAWRSGRLDLRA